MCNAFVICLGSNYGQRERAIDSAIASLAEAVATPMRRSDAYETEPWRASADKPRYLNAVVAGTTECDYQQMNQLCKAIEQRLGRNAALNAQGLIPIDIDIVVWQGQVMRPADYAAPFFKPGFKAVNQQSEQRQ